jgi:PAS domain S-box-containing protein
MERRALAQNRRFFAAPVFEDDEAKTRLAYLLNAILMVVLATSVLGSAVVIIVEPAGGLSFNLIFGLAMIVVTLVLRLFLHRGHIRTLGLLLASALWAGVTVTLATSGGVRNANVVGYFLLIAVTGLLLGERYGYLFALLGSLAISGLFYAESKGIIPIPAEASTEPTELVRLIMALFLMTLLIRFTMRNIAQALERARLNESVLVERTRELEAGQRVTTSISEHTSPDEFLGLVVDLIRDQFDLYHVQVYIIAPPLTSPALVGERMAVLRESTGYAGYQLLQKKHRIPMDHPALVTKAINENRPVLVTDVSQDPDFMPNPLLPDTQSELVVPLKIGEHVIGALDAQARTPNRFSESTVALFQMTADQVAFLFENSGLLENVSEQAARLNAFVNQLRTSADIAVRMSTILNPERLLQQAVELMQGRFGLYHAHIYVLDEETRQLTVRAGSGEVGRVLRERGHSVHLDAEKSLVARAARTRKIALISDTSLESDFTPTPLLPQTRSEMSVPLVAGNEVLGVLDLQDTQLGRFTLADLDTFSILGGQIATALQNARLFEEQQRAERALRESEERYRDLLEHSHDLISTHDLEGQILFANQAVTRILGYDQSEMLKKSIHDLLAPEVKHEFNAYLDTIREQGVASGLMLVQTHTGERRIWEYNNILYTEGVDEPIVRAMAHDITETKRAERALRQSEAKYRALFTNIADPIVIFDQETKLFLDCNQAAIDRYGYSFDELRTMTPHQLHPPEDSAALDENVDDKEDLSAHRYTHVTKHGERIPVEIHTAEIEYEGHDAWISIIRDITERERAERAQERLTTQLRIAADLTEQINAILDPDELLRELVIQLQDRFDLYRARVYLLDEEARDLVMHAGTDGTGKSLRGQTKIPLDHEESLVARAARDRALALVNDASVETGAALNPSLPETRSEVAVPLVVGDKVLGVLDMQNNQAHRFTQSDLNVFSTLAGQIAIALQNASLFEEIRRATEWLREADQLKGDLLSSLNHKLRTPLNSILGYTEIMLMGIDSELDPQNLEYVQAILENGQELALVIRDALDLPRIGAGHLDSSHQEVQIVDERGRQK